MKKKKKGVFDDMQNSAVGMAGLGVTTGVIAGMDAKLPAGAAGMGASMNTLAGFAPVAATAVGAKTALNVLPKYKKKKGQKW